MSHTYRGKYQADWKPMAFANGSEDGRDKFAPKGNLYRYGIANKILYTIGRLYGRVSRKIR